VIVSARREFSFARRVVIANLQRSRQLSNTIRAVGPSAPAIKFDWPHVPTHLWVLRPPSWDLQQCPNRTAAASSPCDRRQQVRPLQLQFTIYESFGHYDLCYHCGGSFPNYCCCGFRCCYSCRSLVVVVVCTIIVVVVVVVVIVIAVAWRAVLDVVGCC